MTAEETFNRLLDYISAYVSLTLDEIKVLRELTPTKTYKKGEYLLEAGEISKTFFFNASGLVRLYYIVNGEERTAFFYNEDSFINPYASFRKQEPSTFFLKALKDTDVVLFGYEATEKLLSMAPKFEKLARLIMEQELMVLQEIIETMVTLSPEERYERLITKSPEVFQQFTQSQIASFLGVKPESLSRIKKRSLQKSGKDNSH